ncbi:uncharacterized protein LOC129588718 [Paramacrobiotus metropolitanus]|uniref:uncharacterized protein LOC129588718 n=1 Tax=Paramacrobiotus metropolitanus TaxID=2943436 RepID=UPI0024465736|nr:uncharacterized protein LOC129588718 [Paramacrobiotus metropolitanus]XP_055339040.1 uncharacterized protein LOC129588718 [Paramacrobiotus metropolitanus]XP_055339041.1 uncharacterized protein LOC129588718 [Paramacrobiotus metropolitanus]XP_055339042.1 uncharacterized protein LOC129588718 [Paramacrobiotus metropolitanus]XP_055339043.1 uncharacterized protein LOC129588718 [Paramacrobiotus metropolitanus]
MLTMPVSVLLVVVVSLFNSQDGASPASAEPQETASGPNGDARGSPAASPSPDPGNAIHQPNFTQPNQKFVPPTGAYTTGNATYWSKSILPAREMYQPGDTPQGQEQGPFNAAADKPKDARVPIHQANIPTSVPLVHSRDTFQWPDFDNYSPEEDYVFHYKQLEDAISKATTADYVADYVDLPDVEPSEIYVPMVNTKIKHGKKPPVAYALSVANITDACITGNRRR